MTYTSKTKIVHETRKIHCKTCGYKSEYRIKSNSEYLCPRCNSIININDTNEDVEEED